VIHNLLPWSLPWKIIKEFQRDGVAEYHQKAPTKRKTAIAPSMMNTGLPPAHRKYLRERRFSPGILLNLWDLHHTGMSADRRWSWRIIAPIFDMACDVMAYTGRSIQSGDVIRWQTSKNEECACDTKELLYGIHVVPDDTVFIVEGVTDVWRLGAGAVATMGIDWNQEQVNILRLFRNRFILFDDHPVAQTQANKLAEALGPFPGNTVVVEDYGADDPGSLDQTAATELMRTLKRSVVGPQ
jgi:DNA primase